MIYLCRIIAAASGSQKDLEEKGTVSADGVPEVAAQPGAVKSEAAVVEESKEQEQTPSGTVLVFQTKHAKPCCTSKRRRKLWKDCLTLCGLIGIQEQLGC